MQLVAVVVEETSALAYSLQKALACGAVKKKDMILWLNVQQEY